MGLGVLYQPPDFSHELVPDTTGRMITDSWGAEKIRPAPETGMHAGRRKALIPNRLLIDSLFQSFS